MKRIRFSKVSMSSIVRLLRLSLALASALLCACQVAPYEVINVDIREYPSVQSNLELAQAISRYARVYLAAHVPSYDDAYEKYINYGASSDTSDGGRAFVWVRFDYKVDGMLERKSALRSEIRSHFENLAKEHAANASVFEALEPSGESIVNALVSGRGDALYANFASVLA